MTDLCRCDLRQRAWNQATGACETCRLWFKDTRKVSEVCRATGFQACHSCDDLECCDNDNKEPKP